MVNIGEFENKKKFDLDTLTRHAIVLGSTGSGKTVLCKSIVEEAIINNIPILAIDPKGDISSLGIASKHFFFRPFSDIEAKANSIDPNKFQKILREKYEKSLKDSKVKKTDIEKYCETVNTVIYTPKNNSGQNISIAPDLNVPKGFKENFKEDQNISSIIIEPIVESLLMLVDYPQTAKKEITLLAKIIEDSWLKDKTINITEMINNVSNPKFEKIGALSIDSFITKKQREILASRLNLLITTPSLKYWFSGESIDFDKMFFSKNKTKVNVIDLRFISDDKEKEFFIDRILQELYNWLLKKQGTHNLRYILYIDEIKSFIPSFPNNPPSKKMLDLLVRQGRAFGLGCLFATQNPGDIDYKMLGNINTRFIGKLRTEQDIEKISIGINSTLKDLNKRIGELKEREFLYNEQDSNVFIKFSPRWLISYHRGPLSEDEIKILHELNSKKSKDSKKRELIKKESEEIMSDSVIFTIPLKHNPDELISSIHREKSTKIEIKNLVTKYTPVLHSNAHIFDEKTNIDINYSLDCNLSKNIYLPNNSEINEEMITTQNVPKNERIFQFLDRELAENQNLSRLRKLVGSRYFLSNETSFYSSSKKEVYEKNKKILEVKFKETLKLINEKYNHLILKKKEKTIELAKKITLIQYETERNQSIKKSTKDNSISLKLELAKLKDELNKLKSDKNSEIINLNKDIKRRVKNISDIYFPIDSPQFKTEHKIIWLPEQTIDVSIKTKNEDFELKIEHNWKGIITITDCQQCKKHLREISELNLCSYCGKIFCKNHIYIDEISGKKYCSKHFVHCEICHKRFGKDTLKECPSCKRKICPDDLMQCPSCGNIVCKDCIIKKGFLHRIPDKCKLCDM